LPVPSNKAFLIVVTMCGMITYGYFCSRHIESMRLGQLHLVNCDVFKTTSVL